MGRAELFGINFTRGQNLQKKSTRPSHDYSGMELALVSGIDADIEY